MAMMILKKIQHHSGKFDKFKFRCCHPQEGSRMVKLLEDLSPVESRDVSDARFKVRPIADELRGKTTLEDFFPGGLPLRHSVKVV